MAQIIFKLKRIHVGVGSGEYGKYYHHLVISDFHSWVLRYQILVNLRGVPKNTLLEFLDPDPNDILGPVWTCFPDNPEE